MNDASIAVMEVHGVDRADAPAAARKTFGEKLEVTVVADGGGSRVWIESRLVFGLIDWGENKRNVERIRQELDALLESSES